MKVRKIPRGTFWLGAFASVAMGLPIVSFALFMLAQRVGIGDPTASLAHILTLAGIFAGVPTLLSGGGVARLVAHRLVEQKRSMWRGLAIATAAMSLVGVAMTTLVAVPLGGMPDRPVQWAPIFAVGLAIGAVTGLAVGLLTAMRVKRHPAVVTEAVREAAT
jgi:O-antigen/teichoic acid export membrane protein